MEESGTLLLELFVMSRNVNDWIDSFLKYTDNSEPPETYRMWTAISVIAGALQRKCFLSWGELIFYPNLYVVLVGPSGKCRKGTAMGVGARFLREVGINMASEAITREALIRELSGTEEQDINPNTDNIYIHSSLTIYAQELTVFLGYNNLSLISDLTDWYDCRDTWTYRTKNMGTDEIVGVWVNLIGATTPDLIRSALPQDAIGGGLSSRMIFVFEEKKGKTVPAPFLTKEDQELRSKLLNDLERIHMLRGEFSVTEEFIEHWIHWYEEQEEDPPFYGDDRFDGYVNRRPNHIMKLCMVLSASKDDKMLITERTLRRAIEVLKITERKMHYTFSGYGIAESADITSRVMATIERAGEKGIHKNDILRMQHFNIDSVQQLNDILVKLVYIKFCRHNLETGMVYYNEEYKKKS